MIHLDRIFFRHTAALRRFSNKSESITLEAVLLDLALALQELSESMQQDNADLIDQLARIERVLESHDRALFADVANGVRPLATAIDALICADRATLTALTGDMMQANASLIDLRAELESDVEPLARWLLEHAPELYHDPATTITEAILTALERSQHDLALAEKLLENM